MLELIFSIFIVISSTVFIMTVLIGVAGFIFELIDLLRMIFKHVRLWNKWRKNNKNSKFFKFLVLIGLRKPPSLYLTMLNNEIDHLKEVYNNLSKTTNDAAINTEKFKQELKKYI